MGIKKQKRTDIEITLDFRLKLEMRAWLYENKIKRYSWYTSEAGIRYLSFAYEEDAMAFKLAWM